MIIGVDGNKTGFEQVKSWPNYISIAQNAETITSKVMEQSMMFLKKDPAAVKDEHHPVRHHHQGHDRQLHRSRVVESLSERDLTPGPRA